METERKAGAILPVASVAVNLFVLLPLVFASACSNSPPDADGMTGDTADAEAAVREVVQAQEDALNARDWTAFGSRFSDTGDLSVSASRRAVGPAAARDLMEERWSAVPSDVRANLTVASLRFVTPDVAIVNIDGEFVGSQPSRDRAVSVLVNRDGSWEIEALRVMPALADG